MSIHPNCHLHIYGKVSIENWEKIFKAIDEILYIDELWDTGQFDFYSVDHGIIPSEVSKILNEHKLNYYWSWDGKNSGIIFSEPDADPIMFNQTSLGNILLTLDEADDPQKRNIAKTYQALIANGPELEIIQEANENA
jgi:hypothetical protein